MPLPANTKNRLIMLMMFMGVIFSLVNQSVAQQFTLIQPDPLTEGTNDAVVTVNLEGEESFTNYFVSVQPDDIYVERATGQSQFSMYPRGGNWNISLNIIDNAFVGGTIVSPLTLSIYNQRRGSVSYVGYTQTIDLTITDDEVASIDVSPSSIPNLDRGSNTTWAIDLVSEPASPVTLTLSSSDTSKAMLNTPELTFSTTNWDDAQTVVVTALDDGSRMSDRYTIAITSNELSEHRYVGLINEVIDPEILADDLADVAEGSFVNTRVSLSAEPTANVTVTVTSDNGHVASFTPSALTFTSSDYNTGKVVIVNVLDNTFTGDVDYGITLSVTGGASEYTGSELVLAGTIVDDATDQANLPTAGIEHNAGNANLLREVVEGGDTDPADNGLGILEDDGFTLLGVRLSAQPSTLVTLTTETTSNQIAVSPAELTFDSFNWNSYQMFQVAAGDNAIVGSPDVSYEVTVSVSGGPSRFTGVSALMVTGTIVENNDINDDGLAGINFAIAQVPALAEDGMTMLGVSLAAEPASDVVVTFSSSFDDSIFSGVAAVSITNDVLTFTSSTWDTQQQVEVGGRDNDVIGPLDYTITASVVSGPSNQNSGGYSAGAGLTATISGVLNDNDGAVASLVTDPAATLGDIGEGVVAPTNGFFTVTLSHRPVSDVVVSVIYSDPSLTGLFGGSLPSLLTFTAIDWNIVQNVDFQAGEDGDQDDNDYTITLDVISGPGGYGTLADKVLTGTIIDDDAPAPVFIIQADDLVNVAEGSFVNTTVSLSAEPTENVTVTVTSDNGHVASFEPSALTFTNIDYNVGKQVRVDVLGNTFVGDVAYEITLSVTGGASEYTGSELVLAGTIVDDATDQANLPTAGIEHNAGNANLLREVVEGGDTDPADNSLGILEDDGFTLLGVRLSAQPSTLVTLTTETTSNQIAVSPAELTFDSFNWNSYQMFQVAAGDNAIVGSPDVSYEVTVSVSGGPSRFTGVSALMVTGTIVENNDINDDDLAGINFAIAQVPALAEDGMTMLGFSLAAEPASDVVVTFSSSFDDSIFSGVAAVSITNDVLTFTSSTWDTQQQVEVGGRDNDVIGPLDYTITASVVSGPSNQNSGGYSAGAGLTATISGVLNDNDGAVASLVTDPAATLGDIGEGVVAPTNGFFTVTLSHRPVSDVVVSVIYSDPSLTGLFGGSLPSLLTFTAIDWNIVQNVDFQAGEDGDQDDNDYTITLDVISGPGGYGTLADKVLTGTIIDDDAPAPVFIIQADDLVNVAEGSFVNTTVSLSAEPTENVTVTVTSDNGHVASFEPSALTFTNIDYNVGKQVRVDVLGNTFVGDVAYEITLSVTGGASEYTGSELVLAGTIVDDATDQANLPTAGIEHNAGNANLLREVVEGGDTDPADNSLGILEDDGFTLLGVRLSAQPSTLVTLTTETTSNQIAVSPAELTFDSFNWNSYQMFQVAAGDNAIVGSPDVSYEVTVSVSGGPSRFTGVSALMVTGTIVENNDINDDGLAGINFAIAQVPALAEDGMTMLGVSLAAEPASDVVVTFSSSFDDSIFSGVAAVSITNDVLTFTSSTWDTQQQVEVGGRDNDVIGPLDYTITASVVSGPSNQNSGGYSAGAGLTATISGVLNDNDGAVASLVTDPAATLGDIGEGVVAPTNGFFTVTLSHRPVSDVVVSVIYSDPSLTGLFGGSLPSLLTFTAIDWNIVQNVDFQAGEDGDQDDNDYTITLDVISGPGGYGTLADKVLTGTIIDDDAPAPVFIIQADDLVNVAEGSFVNTTVSLSAEPTENVTVTVTSDNGHVASFEPSALTFTNIDYNVGKQVRVDVLGNTFVGDVAYEITLSVTGGASEYTGSELVLAGTIVDDATDQANLPTAGIEHNAGNANLLREVVEGGDTDPADNSLGILEDDGFTLLGVRLSAQPSTLVTLTTETTSNQIAVSPAELTFDSFNWNSYQMFQVAAGDNAIVGSPDVSYEVTVSVSGGPSRFTGVSALMVTGTIVENNDINDDGLAGINFAIAQVPALAEDGMTMLGVSLAAEPASDVVVTFSSSFDDSIFSGVAAVSITNDVLTFTSSTWDTQQQVEVGGRDNDVIGPLDYTITASVVSGPSNQNSGGYSAGAGLTATISGVLNDNDGAVASLVTVPAATIGDIVEGVVAPTNGFFTVTLSHRPVSDVVVSVIYSDPSLTGLFGGSLPSLLTFTAIDWNIVQNVDFQAGEDGDQDDNDYTITLDVISGPGGYGTLADKVLTGTIIDNDAHGFTISDIGDIVEDIAAGQDLEVVLDLAPTSDVELTVHTADAQLRLDQATLTFTTTDWNITQTVAVVGLDDDFVGSFDVTVTVGVRAGPAAYTGLGDQTKTARFVDTDVADIEVDSTVPNIVESGSSTNVQVRLTKLPRPGGPGGDNVVLTVTSSDPTEATVIPSLLTFTSVNATLNQPVVVSPVDDSAIDGNQDYTIIIAVVAASSNDAFDAITDKTLTGTVFDNDGAIGLPMILTDGLADVAEGTFRFAEIMVSLAALPTANVTVSVTSDNGHVDTIDPSVLTFTIGDFVTGQRSTINVLDNTFVGDVDYEITLSVTDGASEYLALPALVLTGTIVDDPDDQANLPTAGIEHSVGSANLLVEIVEGGDTDPANNGLGVLEDDGFTSFGVRLLAQPGNLVTLTTATTSNQIAVRPAELIFDSFNWNSYQMFQVAAGDNAIVGNPPTGYKVTVSVSGGPSRFTAVPSLVVTGTIVENDSINDDGLAGINFAIAQVPALEENGMTTIGVSLAAEPASDVVVTVSGSFDDTDFSSVAAVSITNDVLTFTSDNWATEQQIQVGGRDNDLIGPLDYTITASVMSGPSNQNGDGYSASAGLTVTISGVLNDNDGADVSLVTIPTKTGVPADTLEAIVEGVVGPVEASFRVSLSHRPVSDVVVSVIYSEPSLTGLFGGPLPSLLTFSTYTWDDTNISIDFEAGHDNDLADHDYTITLDVISGPDGYSALADKVLTGTIIDDDGFTISGGGLITEGAAVGQNLEVVLDLEPPAAVELTVHTANAQLSLDKATLTFTPADWNITQTVSVVGVDDDFVTGTIDVTVTVGVRAGPAAYIVLDDQTSPFRFIDNDVADIVVDPSTVPALIEGDSSTNVQVRLGSLPDPGGSGGGDVILTVTSNDSTAATVVPSRLTFTSINAMLNQPVAVSPVDDSTIDGTQDYIITIAVVDDSSNDAFDGIDKTLMGTVTDDDVAGFTLTPLAGSALSDLAEGSNTLTFAVELDAQPLNDVVVDVSTTSGDISLSHNALTFQSSAWNTLQTVTVTSRMDNNDLDGNADYTITVRVNDGSSDDLFDGLGEQTLTGMVTDDDVAGFTLSLAGGASTLEAISESGSTTFTVRLNRRPQTNVTLSITSTDPGEATVSEASLVFSSNSTWNAAQTVSVNGEADGLVDGTQDYMINVVVATGSDANYLRDAGAQQLSGQVTDADVASFTLTPLGSATTLAALTEGRATTTFTVVLGAEPLNNVVFDVIETSADISLSRNSLTFQPSAWNTAQTVTVTSRVDNDNLEDDANYIVTVRVNAVSSDDAFDSLPNQTLNGIVTDNDTASFTLDPAAGSSLTDLAEGRTTTTFTVVLDKRPQTNVVFDVSTTSGDISLSDSSLTFLSAAWDTAQTVTITSRVDNDNLEDDANYIVTVRVNNGSSDDAFDSLPNQTLNGIVTDNDTASFTLDPLAGSSLPDLAEGESTTTFTVVLDKRPQNNVVFDVSTTSGDISLSHNVLTFQPSAWSTAQTVTVTSRADNDNLEDDANYIVTVSVNDVSSDDAFDLLSDQTLNGTVTDNDTASFTLDPSDGSSLPDLAEGESTTTFTVVLDKRPQTNVVFDVSTTSGDISLSPSSLTFEPAVWSTAQTVTVTSRVDNDNLEDDANYIVTVSVNDGSSDDAFDLLPDQTLTGMVTDDDVAGFTLNPSDGSSLPDLAEGESTTTFTVVLDKRPQTNVVFDVSTTSGDISLSRNALTFLSAAWDTAQTVTVTSRADNDNLEDDANYIVTVSVNDGSSDDAFDLLPDQMLNGIVTDNDTASFTLDPSDGSSLPDLAEGESTTTFTVVLDKRPQTNVVFDVSTTSGDISLSDSSLTFEPAVWSTAQTVTITSRADNDNLEDDANYIVTVSVNDGSSDDAFDLLPDQTLNGTVTDNDTASFTLNPADSSSLPDLAEGESTTTFTVVLDKRPQTNVVFDVSTTSGDISLSPSSLTFEPAVWSTAQIVTVTSRVDNTDLDGNADYTITVSVNDGSSHDAFDSLPDQTLTGMVTDDDVAGFTLGPAGGAAALAAIDESGSTTFTALLNRAPVTTVTLAITSTDPGEATVSVSELVFTATNWNAAQTVSVNGEADGLVDGPQNYMINVVVASGSDANYLRDAAAQQLRGQVTDADVASFTLNPPDGSALSDLAEGRATTTFTVVLGAQPLSNVVFDVIETSDDISLSRNALTFQPSAWSTALTVTVTSRVDNNITDGDAAYTVTVSVNAGSSDDAFDTLLDQTLTGRVTDDEVASFTLSPAGGATTLAAISESGSTTFTARLNVLPSTDVTLSITSNDTGEATVSVSELVFTTTNANVAQTVSVNGVADGLVDGTQGYMISVAVNSSSDASYSVLPEQTLTGMVTDDDDAGFTLSLSTLNDLAEGSNTLTFTVVLNAQPLNDVVFDVSTTSGDISLSDSSLTFLPAEWNTAQTVTVTSRVDNDITDGNAAYTVTVSVNDGSSDNAFDPLLDQTLTGMVTDDDAPGFMLTPAGSATTLAAISESGSTTFTARLNLLPTSDVTLAITSTDPGEATVSVSELVFTATDATVAQTVSVNGVADNVVDGTQDYMINVAVATGSNASYIGLPDQQLSGQVTDDEVAGFTLSPTSTLPAIAEDGSITFTARLDFLPSSDVALLITSTDTTEATVSVPELVFTNSNGTVAQTVTVNGVADDRFDGTLDYMINVAVAPSSDASFSGLTDQQLSGQVTNIDEVFTLVHPEHPLIIEGTSNIRVTVRENIPVIGVQGNVNASIMSHSEYTVTNSPFALRNSGTNQVTLNLADNNNVDGTRVVPFVLTIISATGSSQSAQNTDLVGYTQTLSLTITDDEDAFELNPASLPTITEGSNTNLEIALASQPTSAVTLALSSSDPAVATISFDTLTFSSTTWDVPQTVAIDGINNDAVSGDQPYTITVSVASTADAIYSTVGSQEVSGMIADDEIAALALSPPADTDLAEGSNTLTFTVMLSARPLSNVVLDISTTSSDISLLPSSLTFEPGTWNTAQNVIVASRVDNNITDGDAAYTVTVAVVDAASDNAFDGLVAQLGGMVTDDEVASFTLSPAGTLAAISESGSTTFTARLNVLPSTDVTLSITSNDTGEATVSVSELVFTTTNANVAQTVTVNGVADGLVDGTQGYMISVAVNSSSDASYSVLPEQTLTGMVTDDEVASFTLNPLNGSSLTELLEGETPTTFTVVLNAQPLNDVVFDVIETSDDISLSDSSLTFLPAAWDTAQTVTVTSRVDNTDLDGSAAYTITVSVNDGSSHDAFDPLPDQTLTGMVTDDDVAGFTLAPAGGAVTLAAIDENGSTTFTVRLNRAPTTNVTLSITSNDLGEATVSEASLTFTNIDWNTAQIVNVNGVTDRVLDGPQNYMINVAVATGSDDNYVRDAVAQQLRGQVTDADVASFTLTPAGGAATLAALAEGRAPTTFTVVLEAQPLTNVVFEVIETSDDISLSHNRLTFQPSAWNTAQIVTVTSRVDNDNLEDDANYMVTVRVNDGSSDDAFDPLPDQTLNGIVTDNDTASFTLNPSDGSPLTELAEGESTTTFTVVLDKRPQTNVVFDVSTTSSDISLPSPNNRLTFEPAEWNTAQTVTVTSRVDNSDLDGNAAYTVTVSVNDGSSDDAFDPLLDQTLTGMVTDDEVASFTLNPLNGSSLTELLEGETLTTFTVVLGARPLNNVVFDVIETSDDISLSRTSLTFLPAAWDTAQIVTVTSRVDNNDLDGNADYTITVSVNDGSSHDAFDPLPDQTLTGMVTDDDVAGFTLAPAGGAAALAAIDESGSTTFTARLNRAPATNVTLSITSTDPGEATVSVSELVFTATNATVAQTVTVNGVADNVVDGPQNYMISVAVAVASGSDVSYSEVTAQQLSGQVTDAQVASFTLTPLGGAAALVALAEGHATTTFTVVLGAEPLSNVVFDVSTTSGDISLSDSRLTFQPSAWDTAQTVTVTSRVDNDNLEAVANYMVTVRVNDGSSDDAFDPLLDQTLNGIVTDNDTASFTLVPAGSASTLADIDEGERTTTFTVALNKRPQTNVVFDVSTTSSDISLSPSSLIFEPDAWNIAQNVTVTSRANNADLDGDAAYTITVSVNDGSSDDDFDPLVDQTLTGMVTDDDEAGFAISKRTLEITEGNADGEESFTIALNTQITGNVTVAVSSPNTIVNVAPTELTFTNTNATVTQTVAVSTTILDDEEPGDDQPFTITISVSTSADTNYVVADKFATTLTGLVVDNDGLGDEETTQVKTAISVADLFGNAQLATDLITARLQRPPVLQPAVQIGGTNLVSTAAATQPFKGHEGDPWQEDKETVWNGDFEELLPGTNFVLPLSDTTASGAHTELWGSVGYIDFEGDPTIDNVTIDYDGQVTGVHVGIGRQYTNGTNFGVSIGSTKVKIDITGTGVEKVERDLVSIHPYIGWSLSDRVSAWLIAGYGDGDYILELENDKIETKASLRMLGGGLQRRGMLGTFNTALRIEGVATRSEIEGVADQNLAADTGSAWLLRTELEIGRTYTSQGGSLIQPFGAVSYRFDGGDLGSSGAGEISVGLRSQFDDAWLADFEARVQVTEADHKRHSVQGYLKYDRSNDRRGLLFSASHSVEYENQDDAAERTDLFTSEFGYGWGRAIFSQRGILDIHLRNEYGDDPSSLSLGIGYTTPSLQLGLDGSTDEVKAHLNYVINY